MDKASESGQTVPSLCRIYEAILCAFNTLCNLDLGAAGAEDHGLDCAVVKSFFEDERGRCRVWGRDVGAHQVGEASLDYQLQDASHIRDSLRRVLVSLQEYLAEGLALLQNGVSSKLEYLSSDSETSLSEGMGETDRPSSAKDHSHDIKNRFDYVCLDISHVIDALFRMVTVIQNPASPEKLYKYASTDIDVSHFRHYEKLRIQDAYKALKASGAQYLLERLVRANLRRRQMFAYAKTHIRGPPVKRAPGDLRVNPEQNLMRQNISDYDQHHIPSDSSEDSSQTTSVATLEILSGGSVNSVPPPPGGEIIFKGTSTCRFECPYCFRLVTFTTKKAWRKHVLEDLQPYVCTYKDCLQHDRLFTKRSEWYRHEVQWHRKEWVCPDTVCEETFSELRVLITHVRSAHPDIMQAGPSTDSELENLYSIRTRTGKQVCPFCETCVMPQDAGAHVGSHLIDVALFTLPHTEEIVEKKTPLIVEKASRVHCSTGSLSSEENPIGEEVDSPSIPMVLDSPPQQPPPIPFPAGCTGSNDDNIIPKDDIQRITTGIQYAVQQHFQEVVNDILTRAEVNLTLPRGFLTTTPYWHNRSKVIICEHFGRQVDTIDVDNAAAAIRSSTRSEFDINLGHQVHRGATDQLVPSKLSSTGSDPRSKSERQFPGVYRDPYGPARGHNFYPDLRAKISSARPRQEHDVQVNPDQLRFLHTAPHTRYQTSYSSTDGIQPPMLHASLSNARTRNSATSYVSSPWLPSPPPSSNSSPLPGPPPSANQDPSIPLPPQPSNIIGSRAGWAGFPSHQFSSSSATYYLSSNSTPAPFTPPTSRYPTITSVGGGSQPYVGEVDGYNESFDWKRKYRDNARSHGQEKPFYCHDCHMLFGGQRALAQHLQFSMKHNNATQHKEKDDLVG